MKRVLDLSVMVGALAMSWWLLAAPAHDHPLYVIAMAAGSGVWFGIAVEAMVRLWPRTPAAVWYPLVDAFAWIYDFLNRPFMRLTDREEADGR